MGGGGFKFIEKKVDSSLLHSTVPLKKSEQGGNKMHYDETLTLGHNEALNFHNVEWSPENVPTLLFCVQLKFALAPKREKRGCRKLSALSFFLFTFYIS